MGRGKVSLNLIANGKSRMSTFKKRKNNLMKKAYELSTLCDVPVCVLIHGPSSDHHHHHHSHSELHTWPPNPTDVQHLLRAYKDNTIFNKRKCFDLNHFFEDRTAKIQAQSSKLRQNVLHQFLCPNPNPDPETTLLHSSSESQLRAFMDSLDSKIEAASAMLDIMEPNSNFLAFTHFSPQDDIIPLLQTPLIPDHHQIGLAFEDLPSLFPLDFTQQYDDYDFASWEL